MTVPLALGQAGLGLIGGVVGGIQAAHRKKQQLGAIEAGYSIARGRMAQQQAQTRQAEIESLNARGLLTGGAGQSGFGVPANIANVGKPGGAGIFAGSLAAAGGRPGEKLTIPYNQGTDYLSDPNARWEQQQMQEYQNAIKGVAGPANNLAGAEQADQSREFMLEQQDLLNQRQQARLGATTAGNAAITGAIGAGAANVLQGGMAAYQAGQIPGPPPASGLPAYPAGLPDMGMPTIPMGPTNPFSGGGEGSSMGRFGLDPVNPFTSPTGVSNFNITTPTISAPAQPRKPGLSGYSWSGGGP